MAHTKMDVATEVYSVVDTMIKHNSYPYATGYMSSMIVELLSMLPVRKREAYIAEFRDEIESRIKVKVKSLMNDNEVEIPLKHVGTSLDPSQERYWTA